MPHTQLDEKEPDIRFQSNATDASMPVEIKVAESWSLTELKAALTTQLAKRYLRERDKRHGVLLLVHQDARHRGWEDSAGAFRTFGEVVAILRTEAERLAGLGADATFAEISVIDVSDIGAAPTGQRIASSDARQPNDRVAPSRGRRRAARKE